jgi:hypothetical protein
MTINIYEQVKNETGLVDLLRRIAELVEQGYTSGYHPGWELVDSPTEQATSDGDD